MDANQMAAAQQIGVGKRSGTGKVKKVVSKKEKAVVTKAAKKPRKAPTRAPKEALVPIDKLLASSAGISFSTAATHTIITGRVDSKILITYIVFTVGGETDITLKSGDKNISGAMDFGGTDEPRGVVINHERLPLRLEIADDFRIAQTGAIKVAGYCLYSYEKTAQEKA